MPEKWRGSDVLFYLDRTDAMSLIYGHSDVWSLDNVNAAACREIDYRGELLVLSSRYYRPVIIYM